tara:strand:- start:4508 stop:5188 length:681 start_codon:yes stop_codon:yes gene_type:complete
MKNLLLILLLANILYFIWGMYTTDESQPGVEVVRESDLGPPMDVITDRDSDTVASVGAVLGSGEMSAMDAVVGRACVTIGPFRDKTDADSAVLVYRSEGMDAEFRRTAGQIFVGHRVMIKNIADDAAANEMLATLHDGGLTDAYSVRSEEEGLKISLGLFGEIDGAERIELEARSLDLDAEISPLMRDAEVFFVDIGLPPGRGAGAIIDKYGEDRVLLRDRATCPR